MKLGCITPATLGGQLCIWRSQLASYTENFTSFAQHASISQHASVLEDYRTVCLEQSKLPEDSTYLRDWIHAGHCLLSHLKLDRIMPITSRNTA